MPEQGFTNGCVMTAHVVAVDDKGREYTATLEVGDALVITHGGYLDEQPAIPGYRLVELEEVSAAPTLPGAADLTPSAWTVLGSEAVDPAQKRTATAKGNGGATPGRGMSAASIHPLPQVGGR